jgi:hypothetical protein
MMDLLGNEPIEEDIPYTREDLSIETQLIFNMYDKLPAKWEGMSGTYLGKELVLLPILCEEYNIEGYLRKYAWYIIPIIDSYVAEDIASQIKRRKGTDTSGITSKT